MTKRTLGNRKVHPVGLGCMNVSWAYGSPPSEGEAARLLHRALDAGCDHFDTARLYGNGANETLIGRTLKSRRDEYLLASKTGLFADGGKRWVDCSPATIRATCEASLKALQTDHIDLYYMHRRDFAVPIEESAGTMADLVKEGKIGGYGLSEMSAQTLRQAHAVHPVTAVQVEYSLWTRNPEIAILNATRELGVALVAFSPLGRGVFAGGIEDPPVFDDGDIRKGHPRFNAENWPRNYALALEFRDISARLGVAPAHLALAWVLSRGDHVHAVAGTRNPAHFDEDLEGASQSFPAAVFAELDGLINERTVAGPRYPAAMQATMDSEDFA